MTNLFLSRNRQLSLNANFLLIQQENNIHGNLDLFLADVIDSLSIEEEQIGIGMDKIDTTFEKFA